MQSATKNRNQRTAKQQRILCSALAAAGAVSALASFASADTASWTRATNASWGTASNWQTPDGATLPPNSTTVNAIFTGTPVVAGSCTQNGTFTINGMTMTSTFAPGANFNISGAATPLVSWLNIGAGGVTNQNTLQLGFTTGTGLANINLTADQNWSNTGAGVNGTISVSRTISGTGKMTKTGDGLLILQLADPNWSGGFSLSQGSVRLSGNEGALGTGPVAFTSSNDTTLTASSGSSGTATDQHLTNAITFGGTGTATFSGTFNFFFNGPVSMSTDKNINASKYIYVNGAVSGPGVWNQVGGGTVVLATANTHGGFNIASGRVIASADNQLGASGAPLGLSGGSIVLAANITSTRNINTTVATGGTVDTGGFHATFGAVNGNATGRLSVRNGGTLSVNSFNVGPLNIGTASFVDVKAGSSLNRAAGTFTVNAGGQLDLRDNDLVIGASTLAADVNTYLKNGYNFGAFDGTTAIVSSAARNNPTGNTTLGMLTADEYANNNGAPTFDGYTVQTGDTLVKYTYFGDVDFNGAVDSTDYNIIDFGFLTGASGWANGDVDYSGAVDSSDYNNIDFAFVSQNGALRRAISFLDGTDRSTNGMNDQSLQEVIKHYDEFGDVYAAGFLAHVPEPTTMAGVVTLLATALSRRQRRSAKVGAR